VNHARTSKWIEEHEPCQKLVLARKAILAPAHWASDGLPGDERRVRNSGVRV